MDSHWVSKCPEQFSTQQVNQEDSETFPPDSQWEAILIFKENYLGINM